MNTHPDNRLQTLSPEFTSRPGWGGQLRAWYLAHPLVNTFRILLGIILVLGFFSILTTPQSPESTPVIEAAPIQERTDSFVLTTQPGEGVTHLAKRALSAYLILYKDEQVLAPEQSLFVVDSLTRTTLSASDQAPSSLAPGEEVSFPHNLIERAVWAARALTPAQREAWLRQLP